ncbi:class I SAM-dependent methyltransferase [Amycolatopsis sp. NPDC023774]|uniref:class I SAM-dependent DNA methyltransferase n=1 Tax=Amycolatopsis sp. NPDC023774 TaxID=3155015 RepID=UPI0033D73EB5
MTSWLSEIRASYDTVAPSHSVQLRDALAGKPHLRSLLKLFAELTDGRVADLGCGPGWVTAHLRTLGVDAFGLDLSPEMIAFARRTHAGAPFAVVSMTDLPIPTDSLGGILAFWSLSHLPDAALPTVLAHFHRALHPGGVVLAGFHVGGKTTCKTSGYGGHPMPVHIHRRRPATMSAFLRAAGFSIESEHLLDPDARVSGGVVIARAGQSQ